MSKRAATNQDLTGRYPLSIDVMDYDTGETIRFAGTLHVGHKETDGYDWSWSFELSDPAFGHATSVCRGRTLSRFIDEVVANEFVSVPRDQFEQALLEIPAIRGYVKKVFSGIELDGEHLERELEKKALIVEHQRREAELNKEKDALDQKERQDKALQEIKSVIAKRELDRLLKACREIGVNTEYRNYTWHGVYTQETALSLAAKAGWHEGAMALVREGAFTSGVVAETDSRHFTRYHDLTAFEGEANNSKSTQRAEPTNNG
jgi:hypothetical protein